MYSNMELAGVSSSTHIARVSNQEQERNSDLDWLPLGILFQSQVSVIIICIVGYVAYASMLDWMISITI